MQIIDIHSPSAFGGRLGSPKFRASLTSAKEFCGLEENIDRFYALKLIKKVGKELGFASELVEMLEYYLIRTNEVDWTEGHQPICYQAVITTAQDLGISERQVRNRENALNRLGALTWEDSGNFKRYGVRDRETGEIKYAFGVDLSPLASLIPALEQALEEKEAYKELWNDRKRKITAYRARIRSLLAEASLYPEMFDTVETVQQGYEAISYSIRSYHSLERLKDLIEDHKLLLEGLSDALEMVASSVDKQEITQNISATDAIDCRHIHSTTPSKSDKSDTSSPTAISFQESVADCPEPKEVDSSEGEKSAAEKKGKDYGMEHISWKMMLNSCSERFKDHIPIHNRALSWTDLVEAANALLPTLGINRTAWWDACDVLGREGAAICIMIIDQKAQDPENPVRNPGGYLRKMVSRAKTGDLNLQGSVFGLLKRSEESHVC
ncbi:MAG: plasmid replication protein RepC [Alphaproteobacteria bacterium]|nr:plasmid replication protein RepC [Alphaproteobacteria bacterium]